MLSSVVDWIIVIAFYLESWNPGISDYAIATCVMNASARVICR